MHGEVADDSDEGDGEESDVLRRGKKGKESRVRSELVFALLADS